MRSLFLFCVLTLLTISAENVGSQVTPAVPSEDVAQVKFINPLASKDAPLASKNDPLASKDDPLASKDDSLASKDDPLASKDGPLASKDDPPASKDDPLASKDDPLENKHNPLANEADPLANKNDQLASKDDQLASKDDPLPNKDVPLASKNDPLPNKDDPLASKDDPLASKDDPVANKNDQLASKDEPLENKDNPLESKDNELANEDGEDEDEDDDEEGLGSTEGWQGNEINPEDEDLTGIEHAMKKFEQAVFSTMNAIAKEILPLDKVVELIDEMSVEVDRIIDLINDTRSAYKFIELQGVEKVIVPYLQLEQTNIRTGLLKLTQKLFDFAPTTTSVVIPLTTLEKLLEIFENDDNLDVKARTMYILYSWLPKNPKVQARALKLKGLEPFYQQLNRSDATIVNTQMKLFSKIIKEHIRTRNAYYQKTKHDEETIQIYKNMGLLETLNSDVVCHGLFIIFRQMWEKYALRQTDFFHPVFEIITDIEPYCNGKLKKDNETKDALDSIFYYIDNLREGSISAYEGLGLNITKFRIALLHYIDKVRDIYVEELETDMELSEDNKSEDDKKQTQAPSEGGYVTPIKDDL